ncbi:MAG: ABC transporter permease [Calditrichaeota bacterium]|nr:MAG: ABC transporter permease [Calditrichota bacterium]MBL1206915.1 ABC transporter permease [Calditrichota bacterium]NOG46742.1 ABC transporter permease [Calditrichota bacterium]
MRNSLTIFLKDFQQEIRSKAAINSILLFAVVTLTAVSFSIGNFTISIDILAALLWIIILFSAMSGFSHVFLKEEESHTADTLKLIAGPTEILLGKFLFNIVLLTAVLILIIPLYIGVFNFEVKSFPLFLVTVFLGAFGLTAGGTIVAALIAKASSRGALFSVLAFPILLPVLILGISATRIAFKKMDVGIMIPEIEALFAYCVIVSTAAIMLFDFIWND